MTTDTPKLRYPLHVAAKRAGMGTARLGQMIKEGKVPGAYHEGGRYYIFCGHFDRWIGTAPPAPDRNPLIREVRFD